MLRILRLTAGVLCVQFAVNAHAQLFDPTNSDAAKTSQRTQDAGDVFIDRSKHPIPFTLRIGEYEDERGRRHKGSWEFEFEELKSIKSIASYLAVGGKRLKARSVWFEVKSKDGVRRGGASRSAVDEDGRLRIQVTMSKRPAVLVPQSALDTDEELVHLILNSETMNLDADEQAEWLNNLSTTSAEVRQKLKEILGTELRKLTLLDVRAGISEPYLGRLYKVVPDRRQELTVGF